MNIVTLIPKTRNKARLLPLALCGALMLSLSPALAQEATTIPGKNDWLFYRYDITDASEQPAVDTSLALIQKLSEQLAANGTQLLMVIVPTKMRIYAEYLPDSMPLSPFLETHYRNSVTTLLQNGVAVVDLEQVFQTSPERDSETPLFMRLDSHWSPNGAMLAASTVLRTIEADPVLADSVATVPRHEYSVSWSPAPQTIPHGDLVAALPADFPPPAQEKIRAFSVQAVQADANALFDETRLPAIALIGSSYSASWTGFADALRYTLQHNISAVSVTADRGQWVGMETLLQDEGFQRNRPRLLIWEIPERLLAAPPSYRYRDPRHIRDDAQWLEQAIDLINQSPEGAANSH